MDDSRLDRLELLLDERNELEARRNADQRRLCIEEHEQRVPAASEYRCTLHLIDPCTGQCIATRENWAQMRRVTADLRPIALRALIAKATPCALHPTPIVSGECGDGGVDR